MGTSLLFAVVSSTELLKIVDCLVYVIPSEEEGEMEMRGQRGAGGGALKLVLKCV